MLQRLPEDKVQHVINSSLCLRWSTCTAQRLQPSLSDDCMDYPPNQFLTRSHRYCRSLERLSWHLSFLIYKLGGTFVHIKLPCGWSVWLNNRTFVSNQLVSALSTMAAPSLDPHTPPSGGDRNRGWLLIAIIIIFNTTGTVLVLTRLYVRSHIKKNLGLEDFFIVIGLVKAAILSSDIYMAKKHPPDLCHSSCKLDLRRGSLRPRAPSILPRIFAKTITTTTAQHGIT